MEEATYHEYLWEFMKKFKLIQMQLRLACNLYEFDIGWSIAKKLYTLQMVFHVDQITKEILS